uniref:LRRCT domain-containing protein n=1 Tax=Trichuris muris TaxID=70415 RepID=A0A5S6QKT7_TRIMR
MMTMIILLVGMMVCAADGIAAPVSVCGPKEPFCTCEQPNVLNCRNQQLETTNLRVHLDGFTVQQLNMQENRLTELRKGEVMPGYEQELTRLDFRRNYIHSVESGVFDYMINLHTLLLSHNKIKRLEVGVFDNMDFGLNFLDLNHNLLENLDDAPFLSLSELKYLYLDENPLTSLGNVSFQGLGNLVELSIENAKLSEIAANAFLSLKSLELLSLKNNMLQVVPQLKGMHNLNRIVLSGNPIVRISNHAFRWVPILENIQLRHMHQLASVEDCAFCGLHQVQNLVISDSPKLKWIDPFAFGSNNYFNREIPLIDFSNNSLSRLNVDLLPWKNVTVIRLENNMWTCDCDLSWLKSYQSKLKEPVRCTAPERLRNRTVADLNIADFNCRSVISFSHARMVTLIILVCISSAAWIAAWYWCFNRKTVCLNWRNCLCRPKIVPYAYRNLAMADDTDQLVSEDKVSNPQSV